ncbi:MAG: ATP-grasp domain-containing protein [Rhodothermales bacterium]
MTTVLVTGTGAIIGYGVLRSLMGIAGVKTIATDVQPHAAGQHFADVFVRAPMTSSPEYEVWLKDIISTHGIDLVIPCIEQDVSWLADAVTDGKDFDAVLALNSPDLIRLSTDKLAFDQALVDLESPARITTATDGDFETLRGSLGSTFLLKPRKGYASKGIVKIASSKDFSPYAHGMGKKYLAQRIVGTEEDEYTVSAFCIHGEVCATVAMKRHLAPDGSTLRATLVNSDPFSETIGALSAAFSAHGPTNFQFRVEGDDAYILEINPRISSATSLRAAFGFNEAMMCLEYFLHGRFINQPLLRSGCAIRYIEDIVTYDDRTHF